MAYFHTNMIIEIIVINIIMFFCFCGHTGKPFPEIISDGTGRAFHSFAVVGEKRFPNVLDECLI